jgi:hypothetical protein
VGRLPWFIQSKYRNRQGEFILVGANSHASLSTNGTSLPDPDREHPRKRACVTDNTQELLQPELETEDNDTLDQSVPGDMGDCSDIGDEINHEPED